MMTKYSFDVVGIGLSAGGIDPLLEIITELPEDVNGAFVVVSHIPINHSSNLDRIIENKTRLRVVGVSTIEYVEPGHIYVLAVGKEIVLANGFLEVKERNPEEKINQAINIFFKSMAVDAKRSKLGCNTVRRRF